MEGKGSQGKGKVNRCHTHFLGYIFYLLALGGENMRRKRVGQKAVNLLFLYFSLPSALLPPYFSSLAFFRVSSSRKKLWEENGGKAEGIEKKERNISFP